MNIQIFRLFLPHEKTHVSELVCSRNSRLKSTSATMWHWECWLPWDPFIWGHDHWLCRIVSKIHPRDDARHDKQRQQRAGWWIVWWMWDMIARRSTRRRRMMAPLTEPDPTRHTVTRKRTTVTQNDAAIVWVCLLFRQTLTAFQFSMFLSLRKASPIWPIKCRVGR